MIGLMGILNASEKAEVSGVSTGGKISVTPTVSPLLSPPTTTQTEYIIDYFSKILSAFGGNSANSLTPTPTSILTNTVPTNTPGQIGDVNNLVTTIRANCFENGVNGRVTIRNVPPPISCLDKILPALKSTVIDRLKDFATAKWDHLQCVQFARAASALTNNSDGYDFCQPVTGAIDCAKNNGSYIFHRNTERIPIKTGDFPIWDCQNAYGHMAYVVKVYDETHIRVAEANWDGLGTVQERDETLNYNSRQPGDPKCKIIGWLTK